MKKWEVQLAGGMLAGSLPVPDGDVELLRRLETENPELHARLVAWILRPGHGSVQEAVLTFVWHGHGTDARWYALTPEQREQRHELPMWFWHAYKHQEQQDKEGGA